MDKKRITTLLDTLEADIIFSDETQENKAASLDTIDIIREELNK